MQVFTAGPDSDGRMWRVEVHDRGRVRVFRLTGNSVAQTPLTRPATVEGLGVWLVERGLTEADLTPA